MKRLLDLNSLCIPAILLLLSGCTIMDPIMMQEMTDQGTTIVDAVEGDKSQESEPGMVDGLRTRIDPVADDPAWAPIHARRNPEHYAAQTGSLFSQMLANDLYDDAKPRNVGDIITVTLNESTKAAKSADADLSKNNDASMDPLEVGGQELTIGDYNLSYNLTNGNNFSGSAAANQSNSISG